MLVKTCSAVVVITVTQCNDTAVGPKVSGLSKFLR